MKRYVLDTSALLTLRDNEPGADRVAEVLHQTTNGKVRCYGCFVSLMEVPSPATCDCPSLRAKTDEGFGSR